MRREIFSDIAADRGVRQPPSLAFLGVSDPELGDWLTARMTPHPLATYNYPAPVGGAEIVSLRYSYIHCTAGPTTPLFATFANKAKAMGWEVYELAAGHVVMLTLLRELAMILINLAVHDTQA